MSRQKYSKLSIAESQLETAIDLFINEVDRLSAITLAGAADVLLCQLVLNAGKENFTDVTRKEYPDENGEIESRGVHGRQINDLCFINELKHMNPGAPEFVTLDIDSCALTAILKAITNHVILTGSHSGHVKAFLQWVKLNLDPQKYNVNCDPNWKKET